MCYYPPTPFRSENGRATALEIDPAVRKLDERGNAEGRVREVTMDHRFDIRKLVREGLEALELGLQMVVPVLGPAMIDTRALDDVDVGPVGE